MKDVRRAWSAVVAIGMMTVAVAAQQSQQSGQPASAQATPSATTQPVPGTVTCPAPAPPATAPSRSFTAPAGMILMQVIPTKVAEFEKFLGYVRDALAKTADVTLRGQAKGWKFFKVAEPGPNNDVLYALVMDPAVPCVDYGFGPLLQSAISDDAKLQEVWALLKTSTRNGGSLMNLVPVSAATTASPASAPAGQKPAAPPPVTQPLDANPNRLPQ